MKKSLRNIILASMAVLTIVCGLMIPHININGDMTKYLPADSRMKEGLDSLKAYFPLVNTNAPTVRAMFSNVADTDSLAALLSSEEGIRRMVSVRQKDSLTLYELVAADSVNLVLLSDGIKAKYDNCAAVETNANSNMPENMVLILIIAAVLIFVILFVMCSSFMEALLFIVTIGMAVVMNMGTNALLPSVSMMTNTIVAVLQFVLSMDYSIILMNRYRMEKALESDSAKAMSSAVRKASSSILSSSLTTIVGLLVLVFMKFRIGMDLGVVLAKGVLLSLISIYTILPALILDFEKAIEKTVKKVPLVPTDSLADFEVRFKWVLCVLFFGVFAAAALLQNRTELSYASVWETEISDVFQPQNSFILLYKTDEEQKLIDLTDSLKEDDCLVSAVSYPSIMKRKLSSEEMFKNFEQLSSMLPPGDSLPFDAGMLSRENLDILYYAVTHPGRDERMSFEDLVWCARRAERAGLVPKGMDIDAMMAQFAVAEEEEDVAESEQIGDTLALTVAEVGTDAAADTLASEVTPSSGGSESVAEADTRNDGGSRFSYENCTAPLPAAEMADFLGMKRADAVTLYRMAGRKGKTMSPAEFIAFVNAKIIPSPLLGKAISKKQKEGLAVASAQIDSAVNAGEAAKKALVAAAEPVAAQEIEMERTADPVPPEQVDTTLLTAATEEPDTPMDVLARMAISGEKYDVDSLYSALAAAEVPVGKDMLEMMYMYYGSQTRQAGNERVSIEELVEFLGMKDMTEESIGMLRGGKWSMAAIVTSYPVESDSTFAFVGRLESLSQNALSAHYLIGEPVMYKEMKDGFRKELVFLTLLTVAAIFLIVAIAFRSLLIPAILIIAVLSGVFVNVFVSGVGGDKMLYLAYLIVQSILMGATIDYGILFTNFYLESRRGGFEKVVALRKAYRASIHTIMTSGMIMVCAPYVMSLAMPDPTISSILACLTTGAFAAISVILLLLPATLVVLDRRLIR